MTRTATVRIAALAGLALLAACADVDGYGDYGPSYGSGYGYGGYGYRPAPQPYFGPSYAPAPYWGGGPGWRGRDYGHRGGPPPFTQGNTSRAPSTGGGFFRQPAAAAPMPRGPLMPGTGGGAGPRVEQGAD